MPPFGFCSGFYESSLVNADCQQCIDFYPEKNESGAGKSPMQLLPTPGTKTFAKLYDDVPGLQVIATTYQGDNPMLTLAAGTYYAALALYDGNGVVQQRSRVFGPFTVSRTVFPPERHFATVNNTFAAKVPQLPPPGYQWYIYFGTDRTNLNQRLPIGNADPVVFGASFITNLPAAPDFIVDPAMGYVITAEGLAQPVPGTGPSWYVLRNGPTQGNQSASISIPHFDATKSSFSVGVLARAKGAPASLVSYYELGLSASVPQIAIYRVVHGTVKVLVSQDSISIPDGSVLQLSVSNLDLIATLNGVQILSFTDQPLINADMSTGTTGFITTGPAISSFTSSTNQAALSLNVVTPGLAAALPDAMVSNAIYDGIELNGRVFVATATGFWEVLSDGFGRYLATILNDFKPKVFASSPLEILLSSAGKAYLFNLAQDAALSGVRSDLTGVNLSAVTEIDTLTGTALQAPVISVGFTDSYFVAMLNDGRYQISGILDGSSWDPVDITKESVFADTPVAMKIAHREIVIYGRKQAIVYYNSGNPFFPFDVVPGSFAELGVGAPDSIIKADNTLFWVGADERGEGMAWRADGYTPRRISTHAIEEHWRKFDTTADAIGWSYQEAGHTFLVWYFPLANETWVYDVATQLWHERSKALRCHISAFGKHLVGDVATATLYEQSIDFVTHDGSPVRRVRRAPHISQEQQWIFHRSLQIDLETGRGPMPPLLDGHGEPRNPRVMVRWSDDGGHTWSQEQMLDCGAAGEYKKRVILRRLGRSRDRVYELSASDPIPWRIVEAHLNSDPRKTA